MASMSSSRSVGRPIMKYSFTCPQPREYAWSAMSSSSSSGIHLLITARSRGLAASGAKVRPVRRISATMSASSTLKLSRRRLRAGSRSPASGAARSTVLLTSWRTRLWSQVLTRLTRLTSS